MLYLSWFPRLIIAMLIAGVIFAFLAQYSLSTTLGLETMVKPTLNLKIPLWDNNLNLESKRFFSLYNSEDFRHMLNLLAIKLIFINLLYYGLG